MNNNNNNNKLKKNSNRAKHCLHPLLPFLSPSQSCRLSPLSLNCLFHRFPCLMEIEAGRNCEIMFPLPCSALPQITYDPTVRRKY